MSGSYLVLGSGHAAIYHLPDPLDGSVQLGQEGSSGIAVLVVLLSGCLFATQMVNHYTLLIK